MLGRDALAGALAVAAAGVRVRALEPLCRGGVAANQNAGCKVESGCSWA
jgi:hypothetical protein